MEIQHSHNKVSFIGFLVILLIFGGIIGWLFIAKVDLTVQAPGEIIVNTYKKEIAHPTGGIIENIYVKEGDFVKKGQKLLELQNNELISQLNATKKTYLNLLAQKERIIAELNNTYPKFSDQIPKTIKEQELSIFKNRKENLEKQIKDLKLQIAQEENALNSLKESLKTKNQLLTSYKNELKEKEELYKKGFIEKDKILNLQRQITQLQGDINTLKSQILQKEENIKELKNKIKLILSNNKKELLAKLQEINNQLPSLKSKIETLENKIKNNVITSPSEGVVTNLTVHSPQEIVKPNTTIMYIVPKTNKYFIEAQINPNDIDKVKVGEYATVNFPSYVDPAAKEVEAKVIYVSADIIKNDKNQYYKAKLIFTPKGLKAIKENNFKIIPGMPVVVFIKAGKRSFASYILLPIEQLLKGAFHAN